MQTLQHTNADMFQLYMSAGFDKSRIVISEYEFSDMFLTLFLEDKKNPADHSDSLLLFKLPLIRFNSIIRSEGLNTYTCDKVSTTGFKYIHTQEIANPVDWFMQHATPVQKTWALESVLDYILKEVVK